MLNPQHDMKTYKLTIGENEVMLLQAILYDLEEAFEKGIPAQSFDGDDTKSVLIKTYMDNEDMTAAKGLITKLGVIYDNMIISHI